MKFTLIVVAILMVSACGKKPEKSRAAPLEQTRGEQDTNLSNNQLLAHAVLTGQVDMARNALAADANPNLMLINGSTVLTYAVQFGHFNMVEMLLDRGSDPNKKDINNRIPVITAVQNSRDQLVQLLISKGATIDERDPAGRTVLMISITRERWDLATWLINQNARLDVFDSLGATPMSLAASRNRADLVRMMEHRLEIQGGVSSAELLANMIEFGDVPALQLLMARGPAILQTLQSPGPVSRAVQSPLLENIEGMLDLFFEHGLSPNGYDTDSRTPLAEAARLNRVTIMDILVKKGANVEKLDQLAYSALFHAVAAAQPQAVAYLLEAGAKSNYTATIAGQTASLKACDVAKSVTPIDRAEATRLEEVKVHLRCGYRRLLFW